MALGRNSGEVAEGVFYKDADERNSPKKFGETYNSVKDEYRALKQLKTVYDRFMPGLYATPLGMDLDENGNAKGYWMENVGNAVEVADLMDSPGRYDVNIRSVVGQLEYLKELKKELPADGDFYPRNLLVERDTGKLRIIDPLGLNPEEAKEEEKRKSDREELNEMIDSLSEQADPGISEGLEQGKRVALG